MKKLTAVWMILALVLAMSAVPAYGEGQPAAEPIPAESEAARIPAPHSSREREIPDGIPAEESRYGFPEEIS